MVPAPCTPTDPVPPPAYHRALVKRRPALHLDALTVVTTLQLLTLCRLAVRVAHWYQPPALPKGPGGRPRRYSEESLLLIALLRTLWRLSYQDMHDWLGSWPALALACGLPTQPDDRPWVPSPAQQCKRAAGSVLPLELLNLLVVREAVSRRIIRARDLIIDSAPILVWRRGDPDARVGHAPAQHARRFLRGYRVHTLICRLSGLPLLFFVAPANRHDAPFARPLLASATQLFHLRPRIVRLDAAYWGLALITWIHQTLGAVAVIPWNPKRQKNRTSLPLTWTKEELGKRSSIERFFARVFRFFGLQRPPLTGWAAVTTKVALTYTATIVVALAAHQAGRDDLIRSPKRVLAHCWEGVA
jgi:transposase